MRGCELAGIRLPLHGESTGDHDAIRVQLLDAKVSRVELMKNLRRLTALIDDHQACIDAGSSRLAIEHTDDRAAGVLELVDSGAAFQRWRLRSRAGFSPPGARGAAQSGYG